MQQIDLPHLAGRIFGAPLAIQPQKLTAIIDVLKPKLLNLKLEGADTTGVKQEAPPPYENIYGTAVISVFGTLVQRSSWLDSASGLTSYDSLRAKFDSALNDTSVNAILLNVDSPGGEVAGLFDLVDHIYSSRNQKPVFAIANELAASAAYAIASAAETIFSTKTATSGSIGIITAHINQSRYDEKAGFEYTMIFAGAHKADGNPHEPLSDTARESIQAHIDTFYGIFTESVARNRRLSVESVKSTEARVYVGEQAIAAGLADKLTTFEEALLEISSKAAGHTTNKLTLTNMESKKMAIKSNAETVPAENEALESDVVISETGDDTITGGESGNDTISNNDESIATAAVKNERIRCASILNVAAKLGVPDIFSRQLINSGASLSKAKDAMIDYAAQNSETKAIRSGNSEATSNSAIDETLPIEERCKAQWEKDKAIRAEFPNLANYTAFKKAEEAGLVRIKRN